MKRATIVIPARLKSERLANKIIAQIDGQPMLWHTWHRACKVKDVGEVIVAVDDPKVFETVESWGGKAVMTDPELPCGTARIASILDHIKGAFIINVQADTCFVDPRPLEWLIRAFEEEQAAIVTLVYQLKECQEIENPNIVKVIRGKDGQGIYFSRQVIPYVRGASFKKWVDKGIYWGHIGVYGYARGVLENYHRLADSSLEAAEKLEQLRFIEEGYKIHTIEVEAPLVEVNTHGDLKKARQQALLEV